MNLCFVVIFGEFFWEPANTKKRGKTDGSGENQRVDVKVDARSCQTSKLLPLHPLYSASLCKENPNLFAA